MKKLHAHAACALLLLAGAGTLAGCQLARVVQPLGPGPSAVSRERPALKPGEVAVTWLGAAGALVRGASTTVAFDPYVSRENSIFSMVFGNPRPQPEELDRYLPRVDLVLVGHAHVDHVLDAPGLCLRDGADLVGNLTAVNVARSHGVPPALLHAMGGGDTLEVRGTMVSATRMDHSVLPLVKKPQHGVLHQVKQTPMRGQDYRDGGPLLWRVVVDGVRVGHLSSTALPRHLPEHLDVDVLLFSVAATRVEPVAETLLGAMKPAFVVPIHHDLFMVPQPWDVTARMGLLKGRVAGQLKAAAEKHGVQVVMVDPMQETIVNIRTRTTR